MGGHRRHSSFNPMPMTRSRQKTHRGCATSKLSATPAEVMGDRGSSTTCYFTIVKLSNCGAERAPAELVAVITSV
jgi:hypothetical protein